MDNKLTILLLLFLFSSCIIDVVDRPTETTVDGKDIETLLNTVDLTNYVKLSVVSELPIIAWVGVRYSHLTLEHFQQMKDAGITINCSYYPHVDSVQKVLDLSHQVGIKTLIDCPELISNTLQTVTRFKDHPANAGYFLKDEPTISSLSYYAKLAKLIQSIDNSRFCYINLLPIHALPSVYGTPTYHDYIQRFVSEIPLAILSFDHYPIIGQNISFSWYNNLEIIRNESNKANIPFWAFALSTAHNEYPITDLNQLRLQVYSNLAYGAKGIQYFTYWTPSKNDYHMGPIERDGSKTIVYDYLKKLNTELTALSYIFASSEVTSVKHYGKYIPDGTTSFTSPPSNVKSIKIRGGNALLSEMKNDKYSFLMIQNNNLHSEIGIKIETDAQTNLVLKNGVIVPASLIKEEFKLVPGDMVIFMR